MARRLQTQAPKRSPVDSCSDPHPSATDVFPMNLKRLNSFVLQRWRAPLWLSLLALCLAAGAVRSAEEELDTDLMQNIEDTNKSLASNIAVRARQPALTDATELQAMFQQVEAFYAAKQDVADAQDLTRKSLSLTQRLQELIRKGDFDTATHTATELSRTCKTCHNFYKKS